jgi:hypothetical protein
MQFKGCNELPRQTGNQKTALMAKTEHLAEMELLEMMGHQEKMELPEKMALMG